MMTKRWRRLTGAIGSLLLFALMLTSCLSEEPAIEPGPSPEIELFNRSQWDDDHLPSFLSSNFDPESARLIDRRNSRTYWVAKNSVGAICLIVGVNVERPDFVTGAGCLDESRIAQTGLAVSVKGGTHFSHAIFVPDGYTASLVEQFEGNYVVTNMVAFDSQQALREAFEGSEAIVLTADEGLLPNITLDAP